MKKTLLAFALSSSILFGSSIYGKNSKYQPYQASMTIGKNSFSKDSNMKDNTVFGIRATAYDGDIFRYGLQFGYESALKTKYEGVDSTSLITQTDMHRIFVNMIVDGEEEYNVVPYLLFGGGYEYLSDEISKQDVSQGFAQTGLGFRYNMTRSLNVALEGRVLGKFDTRDVDFIFNAGIGYMFGNLESSKKRVGFNKKLEDKRLSSSNPIIVSSSLKSSPVKENIHNIPVSYRNNQDIDLSMTVATPLVEYKAEPIVVQQGSDLVVSSNDILSNENLEEVVFEEDIPKKANSFVSSSSDVSQLYIQMAAYRSSNNINKTVSKLRNSGYPNTIVHTIASKGRDLNLVLVGPYLTQNEVKNAQRRLKQINPHAFIYKMN